MPSRQCPSGPPSSPDPLATVSWAAASAGGASGFTKKTWAFFSCTCALRNCLSWCQATSLGPSQTMGSGASSLLSKLYLRWSVANSLCGAWGWRRSEGAAAGARQGAHHWPAHDLSVYQCRLWRILPSNPPVETFTMMPPRHIGGCRFSNSASLWSYHWSSCSQRSGGLLSCYSGSGQCQPLLASSPFPDAAVPYPGR